MKLEVKRFSKSNESTIGLLMVDCEFHCYTLEDEYRSQKVKGDTRIPAGEYNVTLRTEGGFHNRYLAKFGADFHKGMLWVMDVPDFEYILIHIGNDDSDTAGCLLLGDGANNNKVAKGFISSSTDAYKRIYAIVRDAILNGETVTIEYKDEGQL